MFKKLLIILIPLASLVLLTSSQMKINGIAGRTGSPSETNCINCHSDFALNSGGGSITISSPGTPGFQYTPNQLYTITVAVAQAGFGLFGVGVEALNSTNANAGTFTITNASTHLSTAGNGRVNVVHTTNGGLSSGSMAFTFNWTAPTAGTGDVTFYFAGIAADNDGNETGDYPYKNTQVFTEAACTNAPAQPVSISGTTNICTGSTNTYSVAAVTGATSYVWTLPSGWTGTSTTNSINATSSSTSGNITVTANNACGASTPQTLAITVGVGSVPSQPGLINGNSTLCSGSVNTYSVTAVSGATSYTWTLPTGWTGSSTTNSISATASSTNGNITVKANNTCGSSTPQTFAVTVNSAPGTPGTITGNASICSASSNTYSIAAVNGATSYTWTMPAGWTGSSTSNSITATSSTTSGNVSVTANNTCGSSSPRNFAVTINSSPATPGLISGNASPCPVSTVTYSVSPVAGSTSYTWTLPSGWTGTSTTNSISATTNSTSGNVTVKANNGCGSSGVQSLLTTISAIPSTPGTITGNTTPCSGISNTYSIVAVNGATGYTWTLPNGWTGTSTTNSINATASSTSGNITVTANNSCGSSNPQSLAITANSAPLTPGAISGNATVCSGIANTYSVAAVSGATSYTWTLPTGWTGSSSTNSISATTTTTSGNITVKANNGCGSSPVQTLAVTSNSIPAIPGTISGNTTICSGSSNTYSVTAVNGATGYTWTLPSGWTGSSTTNSITITAGALGGNITITANNTCGSSQAQTLPITIGAGSAPLQPGVISGNATICSGSSNTYSVASVSGATGYTWTLPTGWTGTSTTNSITAVSGSTSGNVTVTANNTCGSSPVQTFAITVNSIPATPGTISGNITPCSSSTNTYKIVAVSGATSYTWTLPAGWTGTSTIDSILATSNSTGGNITVIANNTCGSSSPRTYAVTVNSAPASPVSITGNATICSGSSNTYSVSSVNGATSYTWTLPSGWSGNSTTNTINTTADTTNGNISVTANNVCGSSAPRTQLITVNPAPAIPGLISGSASICSGSSNTYSITPVPGATSYTWTKPSGWTGTSTTNSLTATSNTTSGNITVKANNSCGSSAIQTLPIIVNSIPATPGTITGNTSVCNASSNNYSISPVNGATSYTWTFPSGWTGSSTTNLITLTAGPTGGNITVKANDSCGSSSPRTLAVTISGGTVLPQPGIITGNVSVCSNSSNTYSILPVSGATSYTWSLPHGWTGTSTTNSISTTADTTGGIITVWANNNCGPSVPQTITVSTNHTPLMPNAILGNDTICSGSINTFYVDSVSGASTYTWTFPSTWSGTSTSDSIILTADTSAGNITVTAGNNCGTSPAQTMAIAINKAPNAPVSIFGDSTVCSGGSSLYNTVPVNGATSYSWTFPGGWVGSSSTDSISINTIGVSGNINVIAVNSCGSSSAATLHITVTASPSPLVTFVNDTLFSSIPTNNQWNINNNPISGATDRFYVPLTNGIYSVTVTDSATTCSGTSSDYTVNTVGINSITLKNTMLIYPNPAYDKLNIQIPELLINAEVRMYNVYGQEVIKTILTKTENSIDISKLAEGSYSLTSGKANNVTYNRIIILKN